VGLCILALYLKTMPWYILAFIPSFMGAVGMREDLQVCRLSSSLPKPLYGGMSLFTVDYDWIIYIRQ
jgi:hypothetical protein